jgi:iron uptake system EfeUOB component EfeO/EfeM
MRVTFKQKCSRCKKCYVLASKGQKQVICYDCLKKELSTPIQDEEMKKFFDIPEEFYQNNSFLRSIKLNYHRYEKLTDRQKEAFQKTVNELKEAESKKVEKKK